MEQFDHASYFFKRYLKQFIKTNKKFILGYFLLCFTRTKVFKFDLYFNFYL